MWFFFGRGPFGTIAAQFYSRFRERAPTFFTSRFISWNGKHALSLSLSRLRGGLEIAIYDISQKWGREHFKANPYRGGWGKGHYLRGKSARGIPEKRSGEIFPKKKRLAWVFGDGESGVSGIPCRYCTAEEEGKMGKKCREGGGTLSPERILRLHLSVLFCSPLNELRPREMRRGRRTHCWPMGSGRSGRVKKKKQHTLKNIQNTIKGYECPRCVPHMQPLGTSTTEVESRTCMVSSDSVVPKQGGKSGREGAKEKGWGDISRV